MWITEKELGWEIKNKGDELHENFIAAVRMWEMLVATKMKMSGSKKKTKLEHIQHFLHKMCNQESFMVHSRTPLRQALCPF